MTKADLKLLKSSKRGAKKAPRLSGEAKVTWHITRAPQLKRNAEDSLSDLTPAEHAEAARFRALTMERAARQAKVRRLIALLGQRNQQVSGLY